MATLYSDNYDYGHENEAVRAKFGATHSVRVGAEVNVTQGFALRAGYRFKSSPYKMSDSPYNNTTHFISAGFGFRGENFFADFAYVYRMNKDSYWLYDPVGEPCSVSSRTHNVVATIGFKL
jgi:long-subunit fatty acid transport protein